MGALFSCFRKDQYQKLDINGSNNNENDLGIPEDEEFLAAIEMGEKEDDIQLSDQEIQNYLEKLKENDNKV